MRLLSRTSLSWIKPNYKLLKEAGWQAIDISELDDVRDMDFETGLNYIKGIIKEIEDAGLQVGQCHGPMPQWYFDLSEDEIALKEENIIRAVKVAATVKIPYTIVHPWIYSPYEADPNPEKTFKMNVDYLKRCCDAAGDGTTVCVENLPGCRATIMNGEDMEKMYEAVGEKLYFCLDIGHAISNNVKTADFFEKVGDRIKTLHIHDNVITGNHDMHLLPGQGEGDWEEFKETIKKYNYQGNINDESMFSVRLPQNMRLEMEIIECNAMKEFL